MAQICPDSPQATGTWPPPEKKPDHYETTITHTYSSAGTYTATFASWTAVPSCDSPDNKNPYRNKGTATVTITVNP
jgi:hypothetical protein